MQHVAMKDGASRSMDKGVRFKDRRERRRRADMRVYTCLVKAAQAAASHHSQSSLLVQVVRQIALRSHGSMDTPAPASPVLSPAHGDKAVVPLTDFLASSFSSRLALICYEITLHYI